MFFRAFILFLCLAGSAQASTFSNVSISKISADVAPTNYVMGVNVVMTSATSAEIFWLSTPNYVGEVTYGIYGEPAATVLEAESRRKHKVSLTGLTAGQTYHYRVHAPDKSSKSFSFKVPPTSGDMTFLVFNDAQCGSHSFSTTAARFSGVSKDFYLFVGDDSEYLGAFTSIEECLFTDFLPVAGDVPFYPSISSHDYDNGDVRTYDNWTTYFTVPTGGNDKTYYQFDYGDAHFIVLDMSISLEAGSDQLSWFAADIAATEKPWIIVVNHRPPYTTHSEGYNDLVARETVIPLMEQYGAQLMISSHSHLYEHFTKSGIHYVTGLDAGGSPRTGNNATIPEGVTRLNYSASGSGYSVVSIVGNTLTYTVYKSSDNSVVDTWTITK